MTKKEIMKDINQIGLTDLEPTGHGYSWAYGATMGLNYVIRVSAYASKTYGYKGGKFTSIKISDSNGTVLYHYDRGITKKWSSRYSPLIKDMIKLIEKRLTRLSDEYLVFSDRQM